MKHISIFSILVLLLLHFAGLSSCKKSNSAAAIPPSEVKLEGILAPLQKAHPRLLLTDARLQELKTLSNTDAKLKKYAADVVAQADKDIFKSPLQHVLIGPRLLNVSRECLLRVYDLAFAYRWTGNEKYLSSAISNMRIVCAFADWNPSHFLDVAEMTHAVAIGYDWLYNKMDQSMRD